VRVGIVGGGLAGLVVALRRARAGDEVVLFEASDRLGGQIHSERAGGVVVEHGAEGFVAGGEATGAIAREVAGDAVIDQLTLRSLVFQGGQLVELPPGRAAEMLGFRVSARHLGGGLKTLREGMGQLTSRLTGTGAVERATVHRGAPVTGLSPAARGWGMVWSGGHAEVDAVVLAVPARVAAPLIEPIAPGTGGALTGLTETSSVTATLVYARADVHHPLDATGFVAGEGAEAELGPVRACTFVTSKFAHRAPEGIAVLRVFFRPTPESLEHRTDADWLALARAALRRTLGTTADPRAEWVSRWPSALPLFDEHRRQVVGTVEEAIAGRRIWLAGASFHGPGIEGAVASAERCAAALRP
jgi:oxygen-dependent protoporphyrinogen oxidase